MSHVRRYNFIGMTAVEARDDIRIGLGEAPSDARKVYAALAYRAWGMLVSNAPEGELRDWHCLISAVAVNIRHRDETAYQRLHAVNDLLRESISCWTTFGQGNRVARKWELHAQGMSAGTDDGEGK